MKEKLCKKEKLAVRKIQCVLFMGTKVFFSFDPLKTASG